MLTFFKIAFDRHIRPSFCARHYRKCCRRRKKTDVKIWVSDLPSSSGERSMQAISCSSVMSPLYIKHIENRYFFLFTGNCFNLKM
jgi:hypothetical protein